MSAYYDGNLRFNLKASDSIARAMTIGLRSGNVEPGNAPSKVSLDNCPVFGSPRHGVATPISVFAGPRPRTDISRMRYLFTICASGSVGLHGFLVVDVRCETGIAESDSGPQITSVGGAGQHSRMSDKWLAFSGGALRAAPNIGSYSILT